MLSHKDVDTVMDVARYFSKKNISNVRDEALDILRDRFLSREALDENYEQVTRIINNTVLDERASREYGYEDKELEEAMGLDFSEIRAKQNSLFNQVLENIKFGTI